MTLYSIAYLHAFDVPDQEKVDAFLPPFKPDYALNPDEPANLNTVTLPDVSLMSVMNLLTDIWRSDICFMKKCERRLR